MMVRKPRTIQKINENDNYIKQNSHINYCFLDFAFGKCIPVYDNDPEEGSLYQ